MIVFGNKPGEEFNASGHCIEYVGYISDESDMAQLYSFADVYVNTSHQESFCYTVGEALACRTPVVAYKVGGIADQVRHKVNGYLASNGDVKGIAEGIRYCVNNELDYVDLHNSLIETGRKYLDFFETLQGGSKT